jgi:nucleoside-diphosphate-sugar epimerase
MSMTTPRRLPSSFTPPAMPHSFSLLAPQTGSVLRAAVDTMAIWLAFLLSWVIVEERDLASLFSSDSLHTVLMVVSCSLLALTVSVAVGLYDRSHGYSLQAKLRRILGVNIVFLIAACAILLLTKPLSGLTFPLLIATALGSVIILSLARVVSFIVRSEDRALWLKERLASDISIDDLGRDAHEHNVLVIGGGGYIGSALVEKLLGQGLRVSVLDAMHYGDETLARVLGHPNFALIREDFRHIEALTRAIDGADSVIHLGGLVGDPACAVDADLTVDINVTATKVIAEIAKARGVRRFIFASSCSVYGASDELVDEESSFNPQSLYARSKVASEAVLRDLNDRDFSVTCLRFATIYGISGRTRFDLVVNLLCAKAVRDGLITVFGADQWRPFVHVDDVARAIAMTLAAPAHQVAGECFNVGSDEQNYTLGEIAELINKQVPDATITSDDTFVDKRNYRVSFAKIRSQLGFEPNWTIERGIAQVVTLVRTNQVGDYSLPEYSNALYLKERGVQSFADFKIHGWETEMMNLHRIVRRAAG